MVGILVLLLINTMVQGESEVGRQEKVCNAVISPTNNFKTLSNLFLQYFPVTMTHNTGYMRNSCTKTFPPSRMEIPKHHRTESVQCKMILVDLKNLYFDCENFSFYFKNICFIGKFMVKFFLTELTQLSPKGLNITKKNSIVLLVVIININSS